jgi:hypothetical protein
MPGMISPQAYIAELEREFPGFAVREKRGAFWDLVSVLYRVLTLGRAGDPNKRFVSCIGLRVYTPPGWLGEGDHYSKLATLRHERIHLQQMRRLGFGSVWRGFPIFVLAYAFLPLPAGLSYFRYRWERAGYVESIRAWTEYAGASGRAAMIDRAVANLTGASYLFTWPFKKSVRRWFEANT